MYGLNAHVWSRRGVTPCSEIIVGDELPFTFEGLGGGGHTPFQNCGVRLRLHSKRSGFAI